MRFGGQTDPSLPWPVHGSGQDSSMESFLDGSVSDVAA